MREHRHPVQAVQFLSTSHDLKWGLSGHHRGLKSGEYRVIDVLTLIILSVALVNRDIANDLNDGPRGRER